MLGHQSLESPADFKGYSVRGRKGAVAVEAEECSNIGVDSMFKTLDSNRAHVLNNFFFFYILVLKKGGNAVDAAIASALCIGVINGFATGNSFFHILILYF